jgi:hypothetical protein
VSPGVEQGYLVLADVLGHTGFLDVGLTGALPHVVRRRLCRVFAEREVRPDLERLEREVRGAAA